MLAVNPVDEAESYRSVVFSSASEISDAAQVTTVHFGFNSALIVAVAYVNSPDPVSQDGKSQRAMSSIGWAGHSLGGGVFEFSSASRAAQEVIACTNAMAKRRRTVLITITSHVA